MKPHSVKIDPDYEGDGIAKVMVQFKLPDSAEQSGDGVDVCVYVQQDGKTFDEIGTIAVMRSREVLRKILLDDEA